MAAMATMASVSVVGAPLAANQLSSSAAFGASQGQFAPLRNVKVSGSRVVAMTAKYSEEEGSSARQVMSSVLAAGLALTMAGSAFAASGPGGPGGERTLRKANKLLQGADELIKNDSPQRFGPQQGFGFGTDDSDRFSQQAGSGAVQGLQDAGSAVVSSGRDKLASNLDTTKRRIDGIWGMGKGLANDIVGKADEATQGAKKNLFGAAPKINMGSSVGSAAGDVKSKVDEVTEGAKKTLFGAAPKINMGSSVGSTTSDLKSKAEEVTEGAKKTLFGAAPKINMGSSVGSATGDLKSKADEAAASAKGASGGFFGKIKQQGRVLQGKK